METRQNYTVKDVIEIVIRQLEGIVIPASLIGQMSPQALMVVKQGVADPIEAAKQNLIGCVQAINADEARQQLAQQDTEEKPAMQTEPPDGTAPELRIVPAEEPGQLPKDTADGE